LAAGRNSDTTEAIKPVQNPAQDSDLNLPDLACSERAEFGLMLLSVRALGRNSLQREGL
jgi:hypothetical protein